MIGFAALRLFLGGWLRRIWTGLVDIFKWLIADPWRLAFLVALIAALYWRSDARNWREEANTQTARAETNLNLFHDQRGELRKQKAYYHAAALRFAKIQADNLRRYDHETSSNARLAEDRLDASNADWGARFDRLRRDAGTRGNGDTSGSREASMPALSQTPGQAPRPDPSPGQPLGNGLVAVRIDDLDQTVRAALRGREIQTLWIANEGVETSPTREQ